MSPELLRLDQFGSSDRRPARESDCYTLDMVTHEVLNSKAPFTPWKEFIAMRKVLEGERPKAGGGGGSVVHRWFVENGEEVLGSST